MHIVSQYYSIKKLICWKKKNQNTQQMQQLSAECNSCEIWLFLNSHNLVSVILTWNMLSSQLLLPLEEPPDLELSPVFGFLIGFSSALDFFLFA